MNIRNCFKKNKLLLFNPPWMFVLFLKFDEHLNAVIIILIYFPLIIMSFEAKAISNRVIFLYSHSVLFSGISYPPRNNFN